MASAVQQSAAPFWFQEKAATSDLTSNKLCQATFSSKENENKASASECLKGDTQSAAQHLITSEQVQTHYPKQQLELTCTDAPCTPAQSCMMQKVRPHDTPDSVNITPLSLEFMSDNCYKVDMSHSSEHNTGPCNDSYQNKSTRAQRMANYPQFSTMPSKNSATDNRIQLEVQQAGPEFHKENLLSLSLCKHEKQIQKSDLSVSSSHCVGNPPAQRVLATLKGPKLSPPLDNIQCGKLSPLVSWVSHGHLVDSLSLANPPWTSDTVRNSQQGTVGKRSSKSFDSLPASEALDANYDAHKEEPYKPINMQSSASCTSVQLNFHKMIVPSGTSPQNIVLPFMRKISSATSHPLNGALSFASPSQGGAVRCMQVPNVGVCDAERYQIHDERPGKRPKEGSAFKQVDCTDREVSPEKRTVEFLIGDAPSDREVEQPAKKKQTVLEQISNRLIGKEVTDTYAQPLPDLSMQQDHLERECMDRRINNAERICGCLEMETETAETNLTTTLDEKLELIATIQTSPERQFLELPKSAASDKHEASKLFAFPAYAKMPKALSTFSTGEPSLPLCSEMDRKILEQVDDGKDLRCLGTTDADWGKFLALSATPTAKVAENAVNLLPYQQRFQRLQVFLKACNDFDQSNHMQALRSLSAAARSGYAVELETRAIRLSLEEGKEMHRVKLLNVLGKHAQRNQNDIGATPYGPRLPAPGANTALRHL